MAPPLETWRPPRPTPWQQFFRDPAAYLARWIHDHQPRLAPERLTNPITVVCISDTHCTQPAVPDGDLLLHAGDLTDHGDFESLQAQLDWLASLPHTHKVVIAGNHDKLLDPDYVARFPKLISQEKGMSRTDLQWHDLTYLNNSSKSFTFGNKRSLTVFGSPWTRQYGSFAFQYPASRDVWTRAVPEGTDILVTHGPPQGFLDLEGKGCPNLTREVARVRPRLMVFGHLHAGHGREEFSYGSVGRGYQRVMAGDGGLKTVLWMVIWLVFAWVWRLVRLVWRVEDSSGTRTRTTFVNAAVVGGFKNDVPRPATVVEI